MEVWIGWLHARQCPNQRSSNVAKDLKPENILMVSPDSDINIKDWHPIQVYAEYYDLKVCRSWTSNQLQNNPCRCRCLSQVCDFGIAKMVDPLDKIVIPDQATCSSRLSPCLCTYWQIGMISLQYSHMCIAAYTCTCHYMSTVHTV